MGKEGLKDRLEMVSREPTCAKKVPTILDKKGPKDRLEMVSREPTWARKAPRANLGKEGQG